MGKQDKEINLLVQISIVFGICLIGQGIQTILPFPFPGSVISMIILFVLLLCKIIKVHHIRVKAEFLLKNMAFFFIPAGVAIMDNYACMRDSILPLLLVCFISTILTFASTAYTVKGVIALQNRRNEKRQAKEDAKHE